MYWQTGEKLLYFHSLQWEQFVDTPGWVVMQVNAGK